MTQDPQARTELTALMQQAAVLQGRLEQLARQVRLVQQDLQEAMELLGQLVLRVNEAKWEQLERLAHQEPPEPEARQGFGGRRASKE